MNKYYHYLHNIRLDNLLNILIHIKNNYIIKYHILQYPGYPIKL
jgi:hypothetical protein